MHWKDIQERGSVIGIKTLLWIYRIFGRWIFNLVLMPVSVYYFLTMRTARNSSFDYLRALPGGVLNTQRPIAWHSLKQFFNFASHMLDKVLAIRKDIDSDLVEFDDYDYIHQEIAQGQGGMIFTSHHGNLDMCRAMTKTSKEFKLTVVVDSANAVKFSKIAGDISSAASVEFCQVESFTPATIISFQEKINRGEYIAISADRPVKSQLNNCVIDFFGRPACFPKGPFLMQQLLQCPAYFMSCIKKEGVPTISFEKLSEGEKINRSERDRAILSLATLYAKKLEGQIIRSPYEWYNFFDFWAPETKH